MHYMGNRHRLDDSSPCHCVVVIRSEISLCDEYDDTKRRDAIARSDAARFLYYLLQITTRTGER